MQVINLHTDHSAAMFSALSFLLLTYLLASVPFGLLATTLFGGDAQLRTMGSGNIGATNVARVTSWRIAAPVLLLDVCKGLVPVLIATNFWHFSALVQPWFIASTALSAFIGHCFSIYLGFRGGKGVATGAGALLAITPIPAVLATLVWGLILAISGRSSVAALSATAGMLLMTYTLDPSNLAVVSVIALGIALRHAANIQRLLKGEERTIVAPVRWGQPETVTAKELLSQRPDGRPTD